MKTILTMLFLILITQLMTLAQSTQGLIAYYPLDGNANDLSGNNNNGTIIGGVTPTTDRFGNSNKAMQFNGVDGYLEVPNSTSLQSPTCAITIAGWVYIDSFPGLEAVGIVEKTNSNNSYCQYCISYQAWSSNVGLYYYHNINGGVGLYAPVTLEFLRWYFIAATFDGNNATIYLDGTPLITQTMPGPIVPDDNPLTMGLEAPGQNEFLQGKLDDIRIYNRALSDLEVSDLYHEGGWPLNNALNTIIITHGFTGEGVPPINPITETKWKNLIWQFAMADAVSENRDIYLIRKGKIWKSLLSYAGYHNLTSDSLEISIETILNNPSYFTDEFVIQPAKDNVFIFDWTLESAINKHGFAEAAADVLAATLVKLSIEYPFLLNHLHFIGHSRGCVVNSEAIERLIYWASNGMLPNGINVDPEIHMTTLDAHPAGHWRGLWGYLVPMDDDRVNSFNIGVAGWKSGNFFTKYIDNYFETHFHLWQNPFKGLDYFPGLNSVSPSNNDLTTKLPINGAHGLVHTWYHGTVDTVATEDNFGLGEEILRNQWYNSTMGKTQGFYYSRNRLRDLSEISSISDNLKDVSTDNKYGNNYLIFNGNFSKSLYAKASGWSYQGGVTSQVNIIGGNISAALTQSSPLLSHNLIYFPSNSEYVWFRTRTIFPTSDVLVKVYISDQFITSFQLNNSFSNFVWKKFTISPTLKQKSNTIRFELSGNVLPVTEVLIDDVGFWPLTGLRSNVACPVDFHIYDNLGNHTGPTSDTTYVEEIPGSEYFIYEDSTGEKIKTVFLEPLDGNAIYTFKIESRDTISFFNYEIENYTDTTAGTVTFKFDSIAIEPNTVATCTLETNTEIPLLNVDIDGDGIIDTIYTPIIITAVESENQIKNILPTEFQLFQNFPNPFNPTTKIQYSLPQYSNVQIKVFDMLGREVATLVNQEQSSGNYIIEFNSENLSSGIYFYSLRVGDFIDTKKMILLK